jgi:rsbT co-antagonist protein RsbR
VAEWVKHQLAATRSRTGIIQDIQLKEESIHFLHLLKGALQAGTLDIAGRSWDEVRTQLGDLSRSRAQQGFTPTETATFVFSLKRPLFERLRQEFATDADALSEEIWRATQLLDSLGLYTAEVFQKSREDATRIMLHVHQHGVGVCGVFTYEVAETKVAQVVETARRHQHPLHCTMEKD